MSSIKIGVLGGIGPEATGMFYMKLIERLQNEKLIKSNTDFPQIFINSIPAPELVFDEISDEDLIPYVNGLKELDSMNVDFIVMVCNTIHLHCEMLQSHIKTKIVDLRDEIKSCLENDGVRNLTIIGTPSTIRLGLYDFPNINYLNPNDDEMSILSDAIFSFNKGVDKKTQVERTMSIVNKYREKGSEIVLLGCTEFGVMLNDSNIPKINSIDVLIDGVIRRCKEMRA